MSDQLAIYKSVRGVEIQGDVQIQILPVHQTMAKMAYKISEPNLASEQAKGENKQACRENRESTPHFTLVGSLLSRQTPRLSSRTGHHFYFGQ